MDKMLYLPELYLDMPNAYYYGCEDGEISLKDFESFTRNPLNKFRSFELIDGRLVLMAGNASSNHQRIVMEMSTDFNIYLRRQRKKCKVFNDLNLYLFNEEFGECRNRFQPDIMVCCDKTKITKRGYEGVPSFVVEVISKSTGVYDYGRKFDNYIKYGVQEYWIADMFENSIFVHLNTDKDNLVVNEYTFYDKVESVIFPGLSIDFAEILDRLDKSELKWHEEIT